jgi:hypothetical protein
MKKQHKCYRSLSGYTLVLKCLPNVFGLDCFSIATTSVSWFLITFLAAACSGGAFMINGTCVQGNCANPDIVNIGSSSTIGGAFVYTFANGDRFEISTTFPITPAPNGSGVHVSSSASTEVTYLGNASTGPSGNDVLTLDFLQRVQSNGASLTGIGGGYSIFGVLGGGIATGSNFTTQYSEAFITSPVLGPFVGPGSVSGVQPGFPFSGTFTNPFLYDGRGTETFAAGSAIGSFIQLAFVPPATFDALQGGPASAPVALISAAPIGSVHGVIGGLSSQDYYSFVWAGGAFNSTASIMGANTGASYLFSEGVLGSCSNGTNTTLDGSDSFTGTIAIPNLAPGAYCIGITATSPNDPAFVLTFVTPVQGAPEPSTFILLSVGLATIGLFLRGNRVLSTSINKEPHARR